jgi:lysophospholipase L1-like esterase
MLGIAVLLFCAIEGSLSLAALVWRSASERARPEVPDRTEADTYSDRSWVQQYYAEFDSSHVVQWKPYVYWRRRPYQGDYINVDSNGLRITPRPRRRPQGSGTPVKIFMFGGSSLWGTGARDGFTIPALLASGLQHQGLAAEVVNFGETGYVSTQGLITLLLRLREGQRPDVVIFYDGVNDTFSAYQQLVAGIPQNESNRVAEFNLSKADQLTRRAFMVLREVANRLVTVAVMKALLRKLSPPVEGDSAVTVTRPDHPAAHGRSLSGDVITTYLGNLELLQALSEHYHFKALAYWQPTIFQKPHLTKYERSQRDQVEAMAGFFQETYATVRRTALPQSPAAQDLSGLFADVRDPLFVDWVHLGESGNAMIAKRMTKDILGVTTGRPAAAHRNR